ncbi:hypothetical protein BGZ97_004860 [Linnemannia gamsii]|uniref:Secreted protein n=1 Tax=Linnemannia gamsii TaxID=64522 RepID=A0A9P6RFY4_9FUNG|nr:hypothetical protein BGZ97_004860 [Linnemannia gamsii]
MKNIFNIALIATLAVTASVAAHEAPAPAQEAFQIHAQDQTATPTNTQDQEVDEDDEESAMWGKKHTIITNHKHHKHHHYKHGKHCKKDRCCIKYVTITSALECKPEPTMLPPELAASGVVSGDSAPLAHEAAAIMEAWNPPPPAPAW